jgi:hypothetical protein
MNKRELDVKIAQLLGLEILGEAQCYIMPDAGYQVVACDGSGNAMQPVYLNNCFCDDPLEGEARVLGHLISCLEVVPFYSSDCNLAVAALERVCDERGLTPDLNRPHGNWFAGLWHDGRQISTALDASLSLAICKALAGLLPGQDG